MSEVREKLLTQAVVTSLDEVSWVLSPFVTSQTQDFRLWTLKNETVVPGKFTGFLFLEDDVRVSSAWSTFTGLLGFSFVVLES